MILISVRLECDYPECKKAVQVAAPSTQRMQTEIMNLQDEGWLIGATKCHCPNCAFEVRDARQAGQLEEGA